MKQITTFEDYQKEYDLSVNHPEQFWDQIAQTFEWIKNPSKIVDWNFKDLDVKWFEDGETNITINCIDRHVKADPEKIAFFWESNESNDVLREISYQELSDEVGRLSNALRELGVNKGDRVCIYMPMIPEAVYAMLACARIGAIHSVVFAGFSSNALANRINDSECVCLITADISKRGKKSIDLKKIVEEAVSNTSTLKNVIIKNHSGNYRPETSIEHDYDLLVALEDSYCEPEIMKSEDPLFILYTSGSTGKPKGVVHSIAGYMVYTAYSFLNVFQYQEGDLYWCTADVGWITGHSYITYGPLLNGATSLIFEGVPTYPDAGRFWEVCAKYKVNQFYTAPTAIRALMEFGDAIVKKHDLSDLKILGTVGEPINEEAWDWYNEVVGNNNCPIVDTYWQTETGGIMISPIPNVTKLKPCFATLPLPGIQPELVDADGKTIEGNGVEGNLCIKYPWPSMIRTTWGDHERCKTTYFSTFENRYFTGDSCKRDKDGYYRITGRVDDVINVSGHRIGTAEVEDAIDLHPNILEAAVVGIPHDIKGQALAAFMIANGKVDEEITIAEVKELINTNIGAFARPDKLFVVKGLPKTRSGKIMRRVLRKIMEGEADKIGDTSTLLNPEVVEDLKKLI
jgi:acetyl-CoA synthetase